MSTEFKDGHDAMTRSSPAPPHPSYVQGLAAFKRSGISFADRNITDKRDLLNNPPPPKDLPKVAPIITKEILTAGGKVSLTLTRPKGSEDEVLPVAVYL
jgi:acetyl esterase